MRAATAALHRTRQVTVVRQGTRPVVAALAIRPQVTVARAVPARAATAAVELQPSAATVATPALRVMRLLAAPVRAVKAAREQVAREQVAQVQVAQVQVAQVQVAQVQVAQVQARAGPMLVWQARAVQAWAVPVARMSVVQVPVARMSVVQVPAALMSPAAEEPRRHLTCCWVSLRIDSRARSSRRSRVRFKAEAR